MKYARVHNKWGTTGFYFLAAGPWAVDVISIPNCKIMVKIITALSCLLAI